MSDEENNTNSSTNESGSLSANSIINFLKYLLSISILVIIVFFTGSTLLYSCKVGQANILPTDKECYPYTEVKPDIKTVPININISSIGNSDEQLSEKVSFNFDENKKNILLDFLRKTMESAKISGLIMYFCSIIQELSVFNYKTNETILNSINSSLPEWFIMFVMPFFLPVIWTIIFFSNWFVLFYHWFAKLEWLFKKNTNTDKNKKPNWVDVSLFSPIQYGLSVFIAFWIIILYFIIIFIPLPIVSSLSFILMLYASLNPLFLDGTKKNGSNYSFFNSFAENIKYHLNTIMYILSFTLILGSFSNFGTICGVFSVLATLLIYFEIIPIPLFKKTIPDLKDLSPLTSFNQAKRTCPSIIDNKSRSLLSKLTLGLMKGGGSGENDIANLSKNLKKIFKNK